MLDLKTTELLKQTVRKYLPDESYKAFIFGSWAIGDNRKWSDIDIGIESDRKLSIHLISRLHEAFEESNLPYAVDVVDFSGTTEQFKTVAKQAVIPLN